VPPNSLRDLNVSPKMKQWKNKKIEAHFLICSTFGVGRHIGALGWD